MTLRKHWLCLGLAAAALVAGSGASAVVAETPATFKQRFSFNSAEQIVGGASFNARFSAVSKGHIILEYFKGRTVVYGNMTLAEAASALGIDLGDIFDNPECYVCPPELRIADIRKRIGITESG